MLQVDIAWAYGVGSGFAVFSQKYLMKEIKEEFADGFRAWPFVQLNAVIVVLFLPCVCHLLWVFPEWQTMMVYSGDGNKWIMPIGILAIYGAAVFGYGFSLWLIRAGWPFAAFAQFLLGYFIMMFGLVYGWDGTGYQRYFSQSPDELAGWTWANAESWQQSDIANLSTIYAAFIAPVLIYLSSFWVQKDTGGGRSQIAIAGQLIFVLFGVVGGIAFGLAVLSIQFGALFGLVAGAFLLYFFLREKSGLLKKLYALMFKTNSVKDTGNALGSGWGISSSGL